MCSTNHTKTGGFFDSLRKYDKIRVGYEYRKDYFEWAQRQPSLKDIPAERSKSLQVKQVVDRLSNTGNIFSPKSSSSNTLKPLSPNRRKSLLFTAEKQDEVLSSRLKNRFNTIGDKATHKN